MNMDPKGSVNFADPDPAWIQQNIMEPDMDPYIPAF